jgi:broad specificity phosphatase PhoE
VGEFIRRVIAGFERLVKSRNDSSFVVVTHGGVMKVFAAAIMRENIKRIEHASSIIVDLSIRATGGLHAVRASGL